MERASTSCVIHQVVRYHKDEDSEQSDLGHTKVSGVASQYILWSGSLCYPVRGSMLKNKQIFSLVISKSMPGFSTV